MISYTLQPRRLSGLTLQKFGSMSSMQFYKRHNFGKNGKYPNNLFVTN